MGETTFEFKCIALQTVYRRLRNDPLFQDFAYDYIFEISLADVIASGKMIELAAGGIQLVESTYAVMMNEIKNSPQAETMLKKLVG